MPRVVLVSGACGSGKSAVRRLAAASPHPVFRRTAAVEVDVVFMMADPGFDIPWPEAAKYWALARKHCALLARSFIASGFESVLIEGNSLHVREELGDFEGLSNIADVFHVTLDPDLDTLIARMAARGDSDKTPEWLAGHLDYMRHYYEDWTILIDNSKMTPAETLDAIAGVVAEGRGRLA